jgi:RNA polymerase sigma-70 factor (ECF subfamily)
VKNRFNNFKEGDERAFRQYFELYSRPLCAFAFGYCGSQTAAQDIAQECFVILFRNRETINDEEHLRHYLFRAARDRSVSYRLSNEKRRARESAYASAQDRWDQQQDEVEMTKTLVLSKIYELVKKMPARRRAVFELYIYKEMDVRSIARDQKVKESTVYNQLRQAYSFLVKEMPDPKLLIWLIVLLSGIEK